MNDMMVMYTSQSSLYKYYILSIHLYIFWMPLIQETFHSFPMKGNQISSSTFYYHKLSCYQRTHSLCNNYIGTVKTVQYKWLNQYLFSPEAHCLKCAIKIMFKEIKYSTSIIIFQFSQKLHFWCKEIFIILLMQLPYFSMHQNHF